jgi:cytochrome P450
MPQLFGFDEVEIRGPKPVPLIGVAKSLYQLLDDPVGVVMRLRERGDVVTLIDRNPAVVCVFGPERNREILSNPAVFRHDETLFRGPPGSAMDTMRLCTITLNGDAHRRHRKLMQPAFHKSALDNHAAQIVTVTRAMLDHWKLDEVSPVDRLCRETTLAVAMRCLYGLDMSDAASELGHIATEWASTATEPATLLLPLDLPGTSYRKVLRLGNDVFVRLRALLDNKRGSAEHQDVMALLLNARDAEEAPLSDDEVIAEAAMLFVAGHETTAMTLAWTLLLLERHPEVHEALTAELDAVLGGRDPHPEDLPRMQVLDRVIRESMRIIASVPMLFMRVCAEATTVGGFAVPKGSNVMLSPLATHHDPTLYPEPKRFLPDRWIDATPVPYGYLPFGVGPRTCIGMLFAERALRIMLPMIMQRFRFSIPAGTRIDRLTRGNILKARQGLPMRIESATRPATRRVLHPIVGDLCELLEEAGPVRS